MKSLESNEQEVKWEELPDDKTRFTNKIFTRRSLAYLQEVVKQLEIDNKKKMKKLLYILTLFLLLGCSKEEEVVLEPLFEISLDGQSFDPYERYSVINTFGGEKWVDGKLKKIFILYLQIDDGSPRLDRQHFRPLHIRPRC